MLLSQAFCTVCDCSWLLLVLAFPSISFSTILKKLLMASEYDLMLFLNLISGQHTVSETTPIFYLVISGQSIDIILCFSYFSIMAILE